MLKERASGVLLHPTSIPTRYGIGDLGPRAYEFIDWLAAAGQKYWQVLPLCPTDSGGSPYQSPSSFACNPLLISPDLLATDGLLNETDLADAALPEIEFASRLDFHLAEEKKHHLLSAAVGAMKSLPADHPLQVEMTQFLSQYGNWHSPKAIEFRSCCSSFLFVSGSVCAIMRSSVAFKSSAISQFMSRTTAWMSGRIDLCFNSMNAEI